MNTASPLGQRGRLNVLVIYIAGLLASATQQRIRTLNPALKHSDDFIRAFREPPVSSNVHGGHV